METLEIVFATIAALVIVEGLILTIFPNTIKEVIRQIFKNKKKVTDIGLIEIILGLLILFIISL